VLPAWIADTDFPVDPRSAMCCGRSAVMTSATRRGMTSRNGMRCRTRSRGGCGTGMASGLRIGRSRGALLAGEPVQRGASRRTGRDAVGSVSGSASTSCQPSPKRPMTFSSPMPREGARHPGAKAASRRVASCAAPLRPSMHHRSGRRRVPQAWLPVQPCGVSHAASHARRRSCPSSGRARRMTKPDSAGAAPAGRSADRGTAPAGPGRDEGGAGGPCGRGTAR
jgi:hypothetical protein